MLLITD